MRALAFLMFSLMVAPCAAAERIVDDSGGRIEAYVQRFTQARDSGQRIVVDGQCLSACTLVLALVPRERICVTPNASFGFHAAWSFDAAGGTGRDVEATKSLWNMYPQRIRTWIRQNGGLGEKMIYLRGRPLAALYSACLPGFERDGLPERARTAEFPVRDARRAGRSFSGARSSSQARSPTVVFRHANGFPNASGR